MYGPLNESNLHGDLRLYPVRAQSRQTFGYSEWRFWNFEFVELFAQIQEQFRIESSSDLSRENEVVTFVITNQQRAQADALALRIRKAADQKILRQLAFHLEPLL